MKRVPALFLLFLAGFLVQVVVAALTTIPYFCPHFVLLITLACGAFRGSVMAESFGFGWGLALDVLGITTFGIQGFVLCWTGYASGLLSRWIDAEEKVSQMAFALMGSVLYFAGLWLLEKVLGDAGRPVSIGSVLSTSLVNTLVAPVIFSLTKWCARDPYSRGEERL
jgi:rod shape-determining protein MreD